MIQITKKLCGKSKVPDARSSFVPALFLSCGISYNCFMNGERKNIFLTGPPSSGKTTVIRKVVEKLDISANGFYTEEEKVNNRRVGFLMKTLDGRKGYLAHQDLKSDFHIRRYGVSIENIETLAVPAITPVNRNVIIMDEIGKMECFSEVFKLASVNALDSPNVVVGTITLGGEEFIRAIKSRDDVEIHEVTLNNRELLPELILLRISELLKHGADSQ